ncbi:hypothetical protein D3C86_1128050 [compost metagenome]
MSLPASSLCQMKVSMWKDFLAFLIESMSALWASSALTCSVTWLRRVGLESTRLSSDLAAFLRAALPWVSTMGVPSSASLRLTWELTRWPLTRLLAIMGNPPERLFVRGFYTQASDFSPSW